MVITINDKRKLKLNENVIPSDFRYLDVLHIVLMFIRKRTLKIFYGIFVFLIERNREHFLAPFKTRKYGKDYCQRLVNYNLHLLICLLR